MDEVEALRQHARQEKFDLFVIVVVTILLVAFVRYLMHVDVTQLGFGAIGGAVGQQGLQTYHATSVINSPNNTIGSPPASMPLQSATSPPQPPSHI